MTTATMTAAIEAPFHPALRWYPANGEALQHRRSVSDVDATACGLAGPLMLAETTDGRCLHCFPKAVLDSMPSVPPTLRLV
jgi:hypothetical protein